MTIPASILLHIVNGYTDVCDYTTVLLGLSRQGSMRECLDRREWGKKRPFASWKNPRYGYRMGTFEEQYNDPLRSMEIAIVRHYRTNEALLDWLTLTAVNGLIRTYTAEQRRRQPPKLVLDPIAQPVYTDLKIATDGWLGRGPLIDETGQIAEAGERQLALAEIIACLKRIRRSIEMWQKEGGRRGYFEFIDAFLPE